MFCTHFFFGNSAKHVENDSNIHYIFTNNQNTSPFWFANTLSRYRITSVAVSFVTLTNLRTILPKPSRITLVFTKFSHKTGGASATAYLNTQTQTCKKIIKSKIIYVRQHHAIQISVLVKNQTILRVTRCSVFTGARLTALCTVRVIAARSITVLAHPTWRTVALACFCGTRRVVLAWKLKMLYALYLCT